MRRVCLIAAGLLATLMVVAPATATAQLGDVLGDVQWGDDRDEVIENIRADKLDELRSDPELRNNRTAMQNARQRVLNQVSRIEDSYTELEGERTDYDVSVIAEEFTTDNDESFLRVRDEVADRYYFFLQGELYKLVVAYHEGHIDGVGFETFIDQTARQYGEPNSTEHDTGVMSRASWEDGDYQLRVDDRSDFFATYTMTFSDRQRVQQLEDQEETFGGNDRRDQADAGVSQRVEAVTDPSVPDGSEHDGLIDDMLGEESDDISLSEDEESDDAADDTAADEQREETAESASPAAVDDADHEQPTGGETTPGPASDAPSADDQDDEADDDDDDDGLYIY